MRPGATDLSSADMMCAFALVLVLALGSAVVPAHASEGRFATLREQADRIDGLETLLVSVDGELVVEQGFDGHDPTRPTNIKSASKVVISALVGMAIDRGLLEGTEQAIAPLLARDVPADADPRLGEITIGDLLSMRAGLEPTSGPNYGRWVQSRNWVRFALERPFVDEPGGRMLYSTGSTHLLSAILTRVGGRSTADLAEAWFEPLDAFSITGWDRDPQGIPLGGNQMAMTPRSLLAFGELYRKGGVTADGTRLLADAWIRESWTQRTTSRFHADGYGYGWFLRTSDGEPVHYAWGYGGQMLYVVPSLDLTVVMTSDAGSPSARNGRRDELHDLLDAVVSAVKAERDAAPEPVSPRPPPAASAPLLGP